jgi:feruloyl esterase
MRFWLALSMPVLILPAAAFAGKCESLASMQLADTTVTMAVDVTAGSFTPPGPVGPANAAMRSVPFKDLPAFCRVMLTLKPSGDSDIKVEVWLPTSAWNHKFMAVGNGGWAGTISYDVIGTPLASGYATASTDTGHVGTVADGSFALGHPEKVTDFAYRAVHEMTIRAKAIVKAYYGEGPRRSYWNGCSTGGRQGLKEAQRFPEDFDGIVAGAPANYWTHLVTEQIWIAQALHKDDASYIPPSKYALIHNAALAACNGREGVKDDVVNDPTRCKFDPKAMLCKAADGADCLTAPQAEAARKIYAPSTNPRNGQTIFPGLEPGSELGWAAVAGPQPGGISLGHWKYVVFKDPAWDYRTLNFDSDVARAEKLDHGSIEAMDPDLRAFFGRGGKLLQYHGWSDNQIAPRNSVNYYASVVKQMGGASKVNDSYRLFMIPGMAHCRAGDGVNSFDSITAIEQWVEKGQAPDRILAARTNDGKVDRTRPLCAYPQVAKYNGSGSTDDATNFSCRMP